jgi:hypothetical protein
VFTEINTSIDVLYEKQHLIADEPEAERLPARTPALITRKAYVQLCSGLAHACLRARGT